MRDTQEGLDHQADAVEQDLAAVELELREATRALQESRQSNAELQRQVTSSEGRASSQGPPAGAPGVGSAHDRA